MSFYQGYTASAVLDEYAVTFFSLVNAMYRIKSKEMLEDIQIISTPNMKKDDANKIIAQLRKGTKGLHGILEEVRNIKK